MKQGRTPDRVHVVRPPQDEYRAENPTQLPAAQPTTRAMEIIRTLAQISDKLKRSEAERYELLAELREYRKSLIELEDKAEKSEKAYLTLENKLKSREAIEGEVSQRQARFERALKDTENKLVQAAAGQSLLDQRLKDSEDFRTGINSRLDEAVSQQARLDRQMEKIGQDKSRMLRKVERMEEILTETQDTLKARALVLLTDQSNAGNLPQLSAYADGANPLAEDAPWWRKSVRMQSVGMVSMIVAALLFGWTINQMQQPDVPKIAVLENGGLARLNLKENKWEAVSSNVAVTPAASADATLTPVAAETVAPPPAVETEQTPAAQDALDASDEQLMKALEENPEGLAAQLNDIAPGARQELDLDQPVATQTPRTPEGTVAAATTTASGAYDPLQAVGAQAYAQDPQIANIVAKEKPAGTIMARIPADAALPAAVKDLENQAFSGVPEAQHDLAAIYTAGRGGVTQNFEKAATWFREAADQKIANAAYNLGVLYHQGLGVDKDLDRALYWYREAAKMQHPEAQYNLGIAYIEGIGTEYSAPIAAAYFESAANQGVVEAAYNLGLIYENGLVGGGAKPEDALLWYKIAADGGSNDAKAALAQLSSTLNIRQDDIGKLVERMQGVYENLHGRRAGPVIKKT